MNKNREEFLKKIIQRAENWQRLSEKQSQLKYLKKVQEFMQQASNKNFMIEIMDQSFRASPHRTEKQIRFLMRKHQKSVVHFFSIFERIGIKIALELSKIIPGFMTFFLTSRTIKDSQAFVIPLKKLSVHLKNRFSDKIYVNVNQIGEEVLSEKEAKNRLEEYLSLLKNPNVNYISVKASTLFSQINSLAMDYTVEQISKRLRLLYLEALKNTNQNSIYGKHKFVNLDMEEYKDLEITLLSFMKVLEEDEFKNYTAGIVLQAYLPDSFLAQKRLTKWALERVKKGGSPIKIRLVKGANMEMEKTESSLRHWELVTYENKTETDSNYKRMLEYSLEEERFKAVHIGIASHNLFDLSYAYEMILEKKAIDFVDFEMLEGMGHIHYNSLKQDIKNFVFYTPTCSKKNFTNAIGYLVRRLDENSEEGNFMRYISNLKVNSTDWEKLKKDFLDSFYKIETISEQKKRKQNRNKEKSLLSFSEKNIEWFENQADTDFVLEENRKWAEEILENWKNKTIEQTIPLVIGKEEIVKEKKNIYEVIDKCQISENKKVGRFSLAEPKDIETALKIGKQDIGGWSVLTDQERYRILRKVADEIRTNRDELLGIAAAEVGKVFTQTDVEITEAIDFLNFYTHADYINKKNKLAKFQPRGVGVVLSPWNFPIAIPVGSIAAALVTGNRVLFKPSKEAALCGWFLCQCFWKGGVDKNSLQFLPMEDELAGKYLITSENLDFAIFTGSCETATKIMKINPKLFFSGETGGKNAIFVSALSDREQAIKHICRSAYYNSGQKCSAASLLILEKEIYEDKNFREMLIDASESMSVGSVWNFKNVISTLIDVPNPNLKHAIENLANHEEWAIKPEFPENNPYLLKPSIRWGTTREDFTYKTELFGPMLSVMKAESLDEAIDIVNSLPYGLTSGIETLDEKEKKKWVNQVQAGNLYINREITGAIVLRQPFGGMKKSAVGTGRKVGFYNYLPQFTIISDNLKEEDFENKFEVLYQNIQSYELSWAFVLKEMFTEIQANKTLQNFKLTFEKLMFALVDYLHSHKEIFLKAKDWTKIRGEENVLRYIPVRSVLIRMVEDSSLFELFSVIFACKIIGIPFLLSIPQKINTKSKFLIDFFLKYKNSIFIKNDRYKIQSEEEMLNSFLDYEKIRYTKKHGIGLKVLDYAAEKLISIHNQKPFISGKIELLNYYKEQSISNSFHRYGNLVDNNLIFKE